MDSVADMDGLVNQYLVGGHSLNNVRYPLTRHRRLHQLQNSSSLSQISQLSSASSDTAVDQSGIGSGGRQLYNMGVSHGQYSPGWQNRSHSPLGFDNVYSPVFAEHLIRYAKTIKTDLLATAVTSDGNPDGEQNNSSTELV